VPPECLLRVTGRRVDRGGAGLGGFRCSFGSGHASIRKQVPCPSCGHQARAATREVRISKVSALQQDLRGAHMIVWREQRPDFARRPIDELVKQLSFPLACALAGAARQGPTVLVKRAVLAGISDHLHERFVEMVVY
jgi:hypothetical protein